MRILVMSNLFPPNVVGGYERLCCQVAGALAARGHDVHVLTSSYGDKTGDPAGMSVHRRLTLLADRQDIYRPFEASGAQRDAINAGNVAALREVVANVRPDIVFAWNLYFFDRSLQSALSECGVPTVYFLTDNWMIAALAPERIGRFFERHVHGDAPFLPAAHITPTDFSSPATAIFGARFVQNLHHSCGFRFAREEVIHNGVDLPALDDEVLPDRRQLAHAGEVKLLFAGRLVDIKGVHDCIAALPAVQRALPDFRVRLSIVGDAQDQEYGRRLQQQVQDLALGASVTFMPPVNERKLPGLFMAHDIYLFPSLYEPFALTLIHALAAGIPTIASDIGGNTEIVMNRRTGLLFRKGDAEDLARSIVDYVRDPALRVQVSTRARRLAQRFSFRRMIDQVERVVVSAARQTRTDARQQA